MYKNTGNLGVALADLTLSVTYRFIWRSSSYLFVFPSFYVKRNQSHVEKTEHHLDFPQDRSFSRRKCCFWSILFYENKNYFQTFALKWSQEYFKNISRDQHHFLILSFSSQICNRRILYSPREGFCIVLNVFRQIISIDKFEKCAHSHKNLSVQDFPVLGYA